MATQFEQLAEIRRAAYKAAAIAESAWAHELERVYGSKACDARYDSKRNAATPTLAALYEIKNKACDVWHASYTACRAARDV
jgi:hypothetical protein